MRFIPKTLTCEIRARDACQRPPAVLPESRHLQAILSAERLGLGQGRQRLGSPVPLGQLAASVRSGPAPRGGRLGVGPVTPFPAFSTARSSASHRLLPLSLARLARTVALAVSRCLPLSGLFWLPSEVCVIAFRFSLDCH